MRKMIFGILMLIFLIGCGDSSEIKSIIKNELNDPDSAKFKEIVFSKNGEIACISWNARNQVGGYGEWKYTLLFKGNNSFWGVFDDRKANSDTCTKEGIEKELSVIVAGNNAYKEAISLLEKKGKDYSTCKILVKKYIELVEHMANSDYMVKKIQDIYDKSNPSIDNTTKEMNYFFEKQKEDMKKKIENGRC